ncbi:hypothetical protein GUJ93_ZPchr0009g2150 [Zizania palustris]|uniref:Uncharacterized protein n=1 Tax=Zizania palustris TaxID=103762 RepID=A0A8J5UYA8_ZIZPA|nr:hypothetical protein GUJ93_ZPchr0009g2150 [Zizania palustris]
MCGTRCSNVVPTAHYVDHLVGTAWRDAARGAWRRGVGDDEGGAQGGVNSSDGGGGTTTETTAMESCADEEGQVGEKGRR